jgi:hypothetical protein
MEKESFGFLSSNPQSSIANEGVVTRISRAARAKRFIKFPYRVIFTLKNKKSQDKDANWSSFSTHLVEFNFVTQRTLNR